MRISSTKILAKVGMASPGITRPSPARMQKETARRTPVSRAASADTMLGLRPPLLEVGAGLEGEQDARETLVEFLGGYRPSSVRRVVEVDLAGPEPFHDQEVIELPERDRRRGDAVEPLELGP